MHSTIRPIQRAKTAVEEGKHLLAERQKLIKIADRSANGWSVVAEYTADEFMAADSDDEKRLEKAEEAAERKAGLKRRRQQPAQRGAAQTRTQRYTAAQAYGGYTVPQLPPFFPTAPADCKWSGSECPSSRRVCWDNATCVCGSLLCLWGDGAPSDVLPQDTDRHKRISGILLLSQCICVGRIVLS